jgi:hypothetical protein
MFTAAAKHLFTSQTRAGLWHEVNGWLVPKLSPVQDGQHSPGRLLEFRLAGTFLALHLMILNYPVDKISPHVLLYLLSGSCPPDYQYLQEIDPNAASILEPWFQFQNQGSPSDGTDMTMGPGVRHLLAEYLGEPVRIYPRHTCTTG